MSKHVRVFKMTKTHRVGDVETSITVEYPVEVNKQLNCGEVMNLYRNMIIALDEQERGINFEENT